MKADAHPCCATPVPYRLPCCASISRSAVAVQPDRLSLSAYPRLHCAHVSCQPSSHHLRTVCPSPCGVPHLPSPRNAAESRRAASGLLFLPIACVLVGAPPVKWSHALCAPRPAAASHRKCQQKMPRCPPDKNKCCIFAPRTMLRKRVVQCGRPWPDMAELLKYRAFLELHSYFWFASLKFHHRLCPRCAECPYVQRRGVKVGVFSR